MAKNNVTKHSWYSVSLLSMGHFFSDFYANFLPALLPLVMAKLGLSLTSSGMLIMILSLTSNVLQPFFGYFTDKKNLNWLLLVTIPGSALFICSTGFADTQWSLFLLVALSGVAVSIFHPLASSLVSKVSSPSKLGLSVSIFVAGGNLGFALAPIIIIYFTELYGLTALPLLAIPSFILTLLYYRSGIYRPGLRLVGAKAVDFSWRKLIGQTDLIKLNVAMGLRAWTQVAVTTFLPVLLIARGYDLTFAGIILTVFLVGAALGGLLGGYLSDSFGPKKIVTTSLAFAVIPTYFLLTTNDMGGLTWILLFFCGFGLQTSAPSSLVWAQKILPNNNGMTSGMMLGLSFGLGGLGAAFTGTAADYVGLPTALLWTVFPLAVSAAIALTIADRRG